MAALSTAAWVGVGLLGASTVAGNEARKSQNYYNRLAAEQQEKAQDIAQKRNEFNAARERRRQVAQARVARGEVAAGIGAGGVGFGSSGVVQGLASTSQQAGENVGFLNQQLGYSTAIGAANQQAAAFRQTGAIKAGRLSFLASVFQTGAGVASSFAAPKQPAVGQQSALNSPTLGGGGPAI